MQTFRSLPHFLLTIVLLISCGRNENNHLQPIKPNQPETLPGQGEIVIENGKLLYYPTERIPASGILILKGVQEVAPKVFLSEGKLVELHAPDLRIIGEQAFAECSALRLIDCPELTSIGIDAFHSNSQLEQLYLPQLTNIGYAAFARCTKLRKLSLPKLLNLAPQAFLDCSSMAEAQMPMVKQLSISAFYGCTNLGKVTLGAIPPLVSENCFENTPITKDLSIPSEGETAYADWGRRFGFFSINGKPLSADEKALPHGTLVVEGKLISYGKDASYQKGEVHLPASITKIGARAFEKHLELKIITGINVVEIEEAAFAHCNNLYQIQFPHLRKVGRKAFSACTGLASFSLPELLEVGDYAFEGDYNYDLLNTVNLPKVQRIGEGAFEGKSKLSLLVLGAVPPTVGANAFSYNPKRAIAPRVLRIPAAASSAYGAQWQSFSVESL